MDAVDLVDHVPEKVAVDHAVQDAFEDGGDDVPAIPAVGALKAPEIGKEAGAP